MSDGPLDPQEGLQGLVTFNPLAKGFGLGRAPVSADGIFQIGASGFTRLGWCGSGARLVKRRPKEFQRRS